MGLDARVRYTKMVIKNSFIELLKKKTFHQITLKEVCELAEINRSTFYKYYADIYDWKEQMENEALEEAQKIIDKIDSTNIEIFLTEILQSIKNNSDFFGTFFSENGESHALELIFSSCIDKAENKFKSKILNITNTQEKWECNYLAYGCIGVIRCWIKDGMKEPPLEVAKFITTILKK